MASPDSINGKKEQLLLSKNPMLQRKQLEAFSMIVQNTRTGKSFSSKEEMLATCVFEWNLMPANVRNNPTMIKMVIMGGQYFTFDLWTDITCATISNRVQMLLRIEAIKLIGEKQTNLLSWVGKNRKTITEAYTYHPNGLVDLIKSKSFTSYSGDKIQQDYDFVDQFEQDKVIVLHNDIITVCRWLERVSVHRIRRKRMVQQSNETQSLPQRFNRMIEHIVQTRPHNWSRSLNSHSLTIANRLRPTGECLGIELEFVANRNTDIVNWDADMFPQHPWLQFKHDGSIRTNLNSEALAQYQELTWFINGSNPKDWSKMQDVLKSLTDNGAKVNNSCGNHVHIDMRHRTNQSALRTASKVRDAINAWAHRTVSYSRSHNHYCGIDRDHHGNRYTAVNTQCLPEHNTIEIRLGMPTLNFHKLKYWSAFMQYLAKPYTSVSTLEDFMQSDAPFGLKHYVVNRILKFQPTYVTAGLKALEDFDTYAVAVNATEGPIE